MMGGSWFGQLFGNIDDTTRKKLEIAAMESVAKQLNITQDPVSLNVTIAQRAIPTYRCVHLHQNFQYLSNCVYVLESVILK